jgi:hypothetical protein
MISLTWSASSMSRSSVGKSSLTKTGSFISSSGRAPTLGRFAR